MPLFRNDTQATAAVRDVTGSLVDVAPGSTVESYFRPSKGFQLIGGEHGRMVHNSADAATFVLPVLHRDSEPVTFIKGDAGALTIQAPAGVVIADSAAGGTIACTDAAQTYASITLKYVNALGRWIITGASGTWETI